MMAEPITEDFDRIPPQSLEAEMAILGSMLQDNDCIGRVVEKVNADYFYRTAHQKIFAAAINLYEKNNPIDLITLSEELKRVKVLDEVGGSYYLTELCESVPGSANIEQHVDIIVDKYLFRKLIEEGSAIITDSYEAGQSAYEVIDRAEQRIFQLAEKEHRQGFEQMSPIMGKTLDQIEKFYKRQGHVTGIATGFLKLDELTAGLQESELTIIAGRPSSGKTSLGLNIASYVAMVEGIPVGFFSLEMSKRQLGIRLLCAEARVDAHKARTGRLGDDEWTKISMCVGNLSEAPIFVDDTAALGVLEMRAKARRLKKEKNIGLLVIDYLQLMHASRKIDNREREVSIISGSFKALAKELNIPVVALSQLSRAVEVRGGDKRPILSDLRESGTLEQDADLVLFVYRPELHMKSEDAKKKDLKGKAEIIIGKSRNGPIGTVHLTFLKKFTKFADPVEERAF